MLLRLVPKILILYAFCDVGVGIGVGIGDSRSWMENLCFLRFELISCSHPLSLSVIIIVIFVIIIIVIVKL